ncbi:MAG: DNA polymerase III subunit gamma/tau [Piscirickettsiaceae bacterium]|nr:DNA polymerase III subunit gamma/tau [Piscirickettsiaceae bacterium]
MSYLVLARKWRPKTFSEVVGQQHVLKALINGLDQDRLHHAFLFSGTRGVGKTTLARIFAKSLNCEQGVSSKPCGECQSCQEVDAGRFVDLIEVDAASRTKVDDTRELLDNVQYAPSRGRYKVYLIDEVHMLSTSSFNALLKTLEEPPSHVKFLFATTDPQKLPVTILSRCLQFNLRRLDITQISDHLVKILGKESVEFEHAALIEIARAADGSMRDALSLLDQAISFGAGSITNEQVNQMLGTISQQQVHLLMSALINNDGQNLLQQAQEISAQGRDFKLVLNELLASLQRIASIQLVPDLEHTDEKNFEQFQQLAQQCSPELIQLFYQITLHGKRDLPYASDPQSGFEMVLLRMLSFQPMKIDSDMTDDTPPAPSVTNKTISPNVSQTHYAKTKPIEPVIHHVAESPPPVNDATTEKVTTSNDDKDINSANWLNIIGQLKLTAFTRQLGDNSAFIKFENNQITLAIADGLAHLASDKAQERLTSELSRYLAQDIKLTIQQESQASTATLANERAEQKRSSQQQAVDSIHNDPIVAAIKQTFDARIIESTIKPLN